jgi:hypothetical protein
MERQLGKFEELLAVPGPEVTEAALAPRFDLIPLVSFGPLPVGFVKDLVARYIVVEQIVRSGIGLPEKVNKPWRSPPLLVRSIQLAKFW